MDEMCNWVKDGIGVERECDGPWNSNVTLPYLTTVTNPFVRK